MEVVGPPAGHVACRGSTSGISGNGSARQTGPLRTAIRAASSILRSHARQTGYSPERQAIASSTKYTGLAEASQLLARFFHGRNVLGSPSPADALLPDSFAPLGQAFPAWGRFHQFEFIQQG